jgi:hypothetical protein
LKRKLKGKIGGFMEIGGGGEEYRGGIWNKWGRKGWGREWGGIEEEWGRK